MSETEQQASKKKFNLGSKNVWRTFMQILIPTLIAQVISGTFVIFDTFFVSHGFHPGGIFQGIGTGLAASNTAYAALGPAAISYAQPYTFFIMGVGLAIGAGLATIMTREMARGQKGDVQRTMNTFMPMSLLLGAILMVFLLIFAKVLVWFGSGFQKDYLSAWFNNPLMNNNWNLDTADGPQAMYNMVNGHILSQAAWYLRIQALGTIPYVYMVAGIIVLRVEGKAAYATAFSATGLIVNILFDFIFIMILKMNVIGAAIASVMGQIVTAMVYYWWFTKKSEVKQTTNDWSYMKKILGESMVAGTSIMMLQVLTGMVLIVFTFSIGVTNYGEMYNVTNYTAVYQGYNALFIFMNLIIISIVQSMKPIVDYNYATGDRSNVIKARNIGFGITAVFTISVMLWIVLDPAIITTFYTTNGTAKDYISTGYFQLHPEQLGLDAGFVGSIFTDGTNVAETIVRVLFITFPLAALMLTTSAYLQGVGKDKQSSIITFGKVALLVPLVLIIGFAAKGALTATWTFNVYDTDIATPYALTQTADLGMFLALPITDVIFTLITTYFLINFETNASRENKKVKATK